MARGKPLSQAERDEIAAALRDDPRVNEIARRFGRSANTVSRIAADHGIDIARARTQNAREARAADYAARRAELKQLLVDDAHWLREQMRQPAKERKVVTVSLGAKAGSEVRIVDVDYDEPTFADKQRIMTAVGIAVDKVAVLERLDNSAEDLAAVDQWLRSLLGGEAT